MKKLTPLFRITIAGSLVGWLLGAVPVAAENTQVEPYICNPTDECKPCPRCTQIIDLDANVDNEHEFHGRTMLKVINLDPVRCSYEFSGDTTTAAGPNLASSLGFPSVPPAESSDETTLERASDLRIAPSGGTAPPQDGARQKLSLAEGMSLPQALQVLDHELPQMTVAPRSQDNRALELLQALEQIGGALKNLSQNVKAALKASRDSTESLSSQRASAVDFFAQPRQKHTQEAARELAARIGATLAQTPWTPQPQIDEMRLSLREFQATLNRLPRHAPGFQEWYSHTPNAEAYDKSQALIEKMLVDLEVLDHSSQEHAKYTSLRRDLAGLKAQLEEAVALPTEQLVHVRCGQPFSQTKTVKVFLTCTPRKPPSEIKPDDPKPQKTQLGTVVCPSSLSVTTGLSYTGLKERDFQFVGSLQDEEGENPTLVQKVGTKESSDEQVSPVILGHTRFWTSQGRNLGLHASLGPILDFDNNDVKLGFASGVSLSLRDNWFLTLGLALGRETELDGDFKLRSKKVGDLEAPPTTSKWAETWFVGFSYKINQ